MNYEESLLKAIQKSDYKKIKNLVEKKKANVNYRGLLGETPLLMAMDILWGTPILKLLIELGADVNMTNKWGQSPVFYAIEKANNLALSLFIQNKAKLNVHHPKKGITPLIYALKEGNFAQVEMLLKAGAKANLADKEGQTPLMVAVQNKRLDFAKLLIEKYHANINTQNEEGNSALFMAIKLQDIKMVQYLVEEKKAKVDIKNQEGKTPIYEAFKLKNTEIFNILWDAGAKISLDSENKKGVEQYLEEELEKDPLVLMYQKVLSSKQEPSLKPVQIVHKLLTRRNEKGGREKD